MGARPEGEANVGRAKADWVETTFRSLSLSEKVGQMLFVRAFGLPKHPEDPQLVELRGLVRELGVGGLVLFRSELDAVPLLLDTLEAEARTPLLVAGDFERSLSFRVAEGTTSVPTAMALGATRRPEAAFWVGRLTAREAMALGVPWILAPVADINNNPENPIIHLRAFGERPELVAQMVAKFVQGVQAEGALATAKHFPGHGDTAVDSHLALPTVEADRARLEAVELVPFRAAIRSGVATVMVGHLAVPSWEPSGVPATVSRAVVTELLRAELGFQGLVATDALEMKGLGHLWMGKAAVQAVLAGAELLLLPEDARVVHRALIEAVELGQLDQAIIDLAVRRILEAKHRLGLVRPLKIRSAERAARRVELGHPRDREIARTLFEESITVVRDRVGVLPLALEKPLQVAVLELAGEATGTEGALERFVGALKGMGATVERLELPVEPGEESSRTLLEQARSASVRLVPLAPRTVPTRSRTVISLGQRAVLEALERGGAPVVVVALTSPYALRELPFASTLLASYGAIPEAMEAAVQALFGRFPWRGQLPVTIEGVAAYGAGLQRPARPLRLEASPPELVGFPVGGLSEVDEVVERAIQERAFPGAVVAVGRRGKLVHLRAYGKLSHEPEAAPVQTDTIYDLASLTKVVATTTAAMLLYDEGRLELERPVVDYLPCFRGGGRESVTVRHLLAHSSGLEAWAPLYQELRGRTGLRDWLCAQSLQDPPGTVSRYSDLGILLLGEILERASGEPLERLVRRRLFQPLGFRFTDWLPSSEFKPRIAPTEWDSTWRQRLVHGEVHDENAFALGGIAPHAGLFGTAEELARFAQLILWKGVYDGRRLIEPATVELFTRRDETVPGSSRALGWDTKSESGSSAGSRFSASSFGHTGFTGTSLWIDPERELFLILLTNRVHPTRENRKIQEVRPAVADAVIAALERGQSEVSAPHEVATGLDRVARGEDWGLRGKRLGLLTHPAAVTRDGRPALEVLRDQGLEVVRLFAPEHGFDGRAPAGQSVAHGIDPASGLPVMSLYQRSEPVGTSFAAGLDTVVVDLQDVGVRFYTYAATVLELLERAEREDFELVILDRPNPLGGLRVAGPERDAPDLLPLSLVNRMPVPLIHGMTLGELLRYSAAHLGLSHRLTVVPLAGWRRRYLWTDLQRRWVPPSPNLKSPEAALVYPGIAWLEATNVSEGRGTDAPFLILGAPWLEPDRAPLEYPGLRLLPIEFVPEARPEAPLPKFLGQRCRGFRVEVLDPHAVDPFGLGADLLRYLAKHPSFEWLEQGRALDRLLGTRNASERVLASGFEGTLGGGVSFLRAREPFLLYPP